MFRIFAIMALFGVYCANASPLMAFSSRELTKSANEHVMNTAIPLDDLVKDLKTGDKFDRYLILSIDGLDFADMRQVAGTNPDVFEQLQTLLLKNNAQFWPHVDFGGDEVMKMAAKLDQKLVELKTADTIQKGGFLNHESVASDSNPSLSMLNVVAAIQKRLNELKSDGGSFLLLVTSSSPSQQRVKRATTDETKPIIIVSSGDNSSDCNILFYATNMSYAGKSVLDGGTYKVTPSCDSKTGLMSIDVDSKLKLTFLSDAFGFWAFSKISLPGEKVETSNDDLSVKYSTAPLTYSYHCSSQDVQMYDNVKKPQGLLTLTNMQVQAFKFADPKKPDFTDEVSDCVGFFTGAIWTGLFMSLMFIIILSIGVGMLAGISTPDRFDSRSSGNIKVIERN